MRNENTMKVSLTPDRLRTMDVSGQRSDYVSTLELLKVYKAEKDQRNRRPAPLSIQKSDSELPSAPRVEQRRPSNRHVESIAEGEEDSAFPSQPAQLTPSRPRGASVACLAALDPTLAGTGPRWLYYSFAAGLFLYQTFDSTLPPALS